MPDDTHPAPRLFKGVMLSSTFTDLKEHRAALREAIGRQGLKDIAMENDPARADVDVIDSSLQMVRDASAYALVIGRKYGQIPVSQDRNPHQLSLTEIEFNKAQELKLPILLFIMGENHLLRAADRSEEHTSELQSLRHLVCR